MWFVHGPYMALFPMWSFPVFLVPTWSLRAPYDVPIWYPYGFYMVSMVPMWSAWSIHGQHGPYMVSMVHTWSAWSIHGQHGPYMVSMVHTWSAWSIHGQHVPYMVSMVPAWSEWSIYGQCVACRRLCFITLPTRSEEEQTVVMICRPNSFDRMFNLMMMTRTQ
jgi:hypothetical protein